MLDSDEGGGRDLGECLSRLASALGEEGEGMKITIPKLSLIVLVGPSSGTLGEFALGIEGLERFVRREPLRWVHECVFGVLALESEPVDPRL